MKLWIFAFLLLTACSPSIIGSVVLDVVQEPPRELTTEPEVYFCPRDDCADKLLSLIESTKNTIHCALFDLDIPELTNAFIEKSKVAEVRIVIDDHNVGKLDKWYFIRKDTSSQLSHNKFCIVDNQLVWTGSFNPTFRGNSSNNNNAVLLNSFNLARNYEDEFQELWRGEFGRGEQVRYPVLYLNEKKVENYFCPEDNCIEKINNILQQAKSSIYFMTFSFTHDTIGDTLVQKHQEGIKVQGVFEKSQNNAYLEKPKLEQAGINVKFDNNKANMHHKVFIVDESIVITGSMNPSKNGDENNDENVIIFHDQAIAEKYLEEFESVWSE